MKYILKSILFICILESFFTLKNSKIKITGGIAKTDCYYDYEERYYQFFIPMEAEGYPTFELELEKPEGKVAKCYPDEQPDSRLLKCRINTLDILLFKNPVILKSEYDWNQKGYDMEGWDTYIKPTISESAICVNLDYNIFLTWDEEDRISDICDNGSHKITIKGDFLEKKNVNDLSETYNFELPIKVNSKDAKAQCEIKPQRNSEKLNSQVYLLYCTFKGSNTFQIEPVLVNTDKGEPFFIDKLSTYKLKDCGASLLKLSYLIILILFL